jgi:hypothetical protein
MGDALPDQRAAITGLRLRTGVGYSFHHPRDWHAAGWHDGREGELLLPEAGDPATLFAVETIALEQPWRRDDVPVAAEELRAVVDELEGSQLDELDTKSTGTLHAISAKFAFADERSTRRRWVRILVQGTRQLNVMAQGSSAERYAHWAGPLYTTMMSVRVHPGDSPPDPRTLL